jgi:hypothetical protein
VQDHGLPRQNMTTNNAIKIGKGLGTLMEVENFETPGLICRQYLRFRVDLNTAQPLIPGFHLPRPEKEPLWISFRYERLGDYCTICGLIGHKMNNCSNHSHALPHINYHIPLQATGSLGPRMSFAREDSDSGMSFEGLASSRSEATSGFSHGGESSHMQIVPRLSYSYIICHVLSPQDLSSENSFDCTRVEDLGLRHQKLDFSVAHESQAATSTNSINVIIQAARDKGKAPLVYSHEPKNQPSLIATDVYCSKLYGSTPATFDSTITKIQELSEGPNQKYQAQFTDFLSFWAQPPFSPPSEFNST